jgi:membrane fusion protein, multidrug efflux system
VSSSSFYFPIPRRGCVAFLSASLALLFVTSCKRETAPAQAPQVSAAAVPANEKAAPEKTAAATKSTAEKAAPEKGAPEKSVAEKSGEKNPVAAKKAVEAEKAKARQLAAEAVPVEVAPVTRGPISAFLTFNSTLETEAIVDIYPQTAGQVETLFVEEGRVVKEGEPLLKIEDRELRVDVEESTANFEHLKRGFARTDDLFQRNLINKQEYDDKRYTLEQARLRLERAKLRLSYTTVRAPFDGVVSSREAQVGARVTTGTKCFSMVKLDELVARVFVPGRYLPVVSENLPAVVTSEFLPNRTFTGWVKRISPVIDPKSGTFKVTIGVRGEKPSELPPGLFVGVRVITDTRPEALLIPKRAVVYEGGERYVFAVVKDRASKRKLVAGYDDPMNIEALSGFEAGTPVIVLGHSGLKDGAMVRLVNPPGAPAPAVAEAPDAMKPAAPKPEPKAAAATSAEAPKAGG